MVLWDFIGANGNERDGEGKATPPPKKALLPDYYCVSFVKVKWGAVNLWGFSVYFLRCIWVVLSGERMLRMSNEEAALFSQPGFH